MKCPSIVTNPRTLRAMEKAGFIEWPDICERHWTGYTIRSRWVRPGPKLRSTYQVFKYRGKEYQLRYLDGCFHPFVHCIGTPLPAFV